MLKIISLLLLTFFLIGCNNNVENKTDIVHEIKHNNQFEHDKKNTKIEIKKDKQENFSLDKDEEKMLENLLNF